MVIKGGDYFKYFYHKGCNHSREVINQGMAIVRENTMHVGYFNPNVNYIPCE